MKQEVFKHLADFKSMTIYLLTVATFNQQLNNLVSIVIATIITMPIIIDIVTTTTIIIIIAIIVAKVTVIVAIIKRVFLFLNFP